MTIWSYIVQIQNTQNTQSDQTTTSNSTSNSSGSYNSSSSNSSSFVTSAIQEVGSEYLTILASSTCSSIPEDGGIVLNLIADIIVAAFIILVTVMAWVFWLNKEEQKTLSSNDYNGQSAGSECEDPDPATPQEEFKFVWYKAFFQIWMTSDATVELRQGIDGVRYMHLSEYLNILLTIITVLCICIILPINLTGDQETTIFGKFCITNLDSTSSLLWAHYILAPLFLLLTLVIVWIYTGELGTVKLEEDDRVAIVKGVDPLWKEEQFWNYFGATMSKDFIVDIQLGYDVSDLYEIIRDREEVSKLQTRYKDLQIEEPEGDMSYTLRHCGCCGEEVEGLPHFTDKLGASNEAMLAERIAVKGKRCNHVFVVWSTPGHCKMFINTHKLSNICNVIQEQKEYGSHAWQVRPAPFHRDINWENISIPKWLWWTRAAIINFILLLFIIFFTTPIMVVLAITNTLDLQVYISSFYYIYITILLLIILTNILPEIVNWTCKLEQHRTKSGYYHWVLKKAFAYLLISVEILPLFGYNSIATWLAELLSDDASGIESMFSCMFSVYNLAFFCNLIIAAALVGRSIELLQVKGIYTYIWERSRARTKRERIQIFKSIKRSFNIGYNYAKLQSYLCIVITVSLFCPIITVFGMFFMVLKYTVDKFLMVWRTSPCGSYNTSTHYTSAYFTVFSAVILQIFMFIYAIVYIDIYNGKTLLSGVVLLLIVVFLATKFGEMCYTSIFPRRPDERDFIDRPGADHLKDAYIPPVMTDDKARRKRAKRAYQTHSRNYSLSSISALIDNGIGLSNNYKSISSKVGSISGRSIISYLDGPSTSTEKNDSTEDFLTPDTMRRADITDDDVVKRDDDVASPRDDDVTSPRDDDVTSPRDDDVTSPRDDDVTTPRDDDVTSPRDDDSVAIDLRRDET